MEKSKQSKNLKGGVPSVDRISNLPESLLCHILSLLPTNYAVQTSILSKRWKLLWTSVTSLEFDDVLFNGDDEKENQRFEQFVYRVLVLLRSPSLHKFHLHCEQVSDPFLVSTWAYAALSRNVRELIIDACLPESCEIPVSLFACKTLSYLSLDCDTTLDMPNTVCLPNLKCLYLSGVKYANDATVPKLLFGCPALEDLTFQRVFMDNIFNFSIASPSLKFLVLNFQIDMEPDSPRQTLQIDAPLLQYLYLNDQVSNEFLIGNLSSLMTADISVQNAGNNDETAYGNEVLKLMNGLSNVRFLELSGSTMKALSYTREHAVPVLRYLSKLQGNFSGSKYKSFNILPDHIPKYLLSQLTTVEIADFDGSLNELVMVKFILKNAKSLERMTINTTHMEAKLELLKEITMSYSDRDPKLCELVVR